MSEELVARVTAYDKAWIERRPEDLRRFLHPYVVFSGPDFERLATGIDACVQSYIDFLAQAQVHRFDPGGYIVDLFGDVAVMTYRWTIDYETGGQRCVERGQELLVWLRQTQEWVICWRAQQPAPRVET